MFPKVLGILHIVHIVSPFWWVVDALSVVCCELLYDNSAWQTTLLAGWSAPSPFNRVMLGYGAISSLYMTRGHFLNDGTQSLFSNRFSDWWLCTVWLASYSVGLRSSTLNTEADIKRTVSPLIVVLILVLFSSLLCHHLLLFLSPPTHVLCCISAECNRFSHVLWGLYEAIRGNVSIHQERCYK